MQNGYAALSLCGGRVLTQNDDAKVARKRERERESEKKKEREEEVRIGRDGVRCEGSSEYTAGMHTNTQTHLGKKPTSQRHRP